MDTLHALILAFIQGITEFLPISSSAHLILPHEILGWKDQGLAFDVMVHLGTLLAVIFYLRKDVVLMIQEGVLAAFGRSKAFHGRLAWLVVAATLPAVFFGLLINTFFEFRSAWWIAGTTIIFGLLLLYADKNAREALKLESITLYHAVLIGLAQAIALVPGTSRSGITITAALLIGFNRESSARFSFLMSIPVILAAGLLKGLDLYQGEAAGYTDIGLLLMAAAMSFFSALLCLVIFMKLIEKITMLPYVIYRLALGIFLIGFLSVAS